MALTKNDTIRNQIKKSRVFQYEIADELGVSEMTLVGWLRKELSEEKKQRIISAITKLKEGEFNAITTNAHNK